MGKTPILEINIKQGNKLGFCKLNNLYIKQSKIHSQLVK